jgi:hypothetical protein
VIEEIFLCHHGDDAPEINLLAEELRLRGLVPWVDKDGGFSVGDESAGGADHAIDKDCFGLLLYATPEVFGSDFVRQVEIRRALRRRDEDSSFVLFAVPRRMGFEELSAKSVETFGVDLAAYSSVKIGGDGSEGEEWVRSRLADVADELLGKVLDRSSQGVKTDTVQMQFSTRERLPDEPEDILCVDSVDVLARVSRRYDQPAAWRRVQEALLAVKRQISNRFGRPRLRTHGSKHLTAAFLLGHTFPSTTCELEIRTKHDYWVTDCEPTREHLLEANVRDGSVGSEILYVEISTGDKSVRDGVRRHLQGTRLSPFKYMRLTPTPKLAVASHMSNADACVIAHQVRRALTNVVSEYGFSEIHIFAAIPQALAVMIGHGLNAMPTIHLYEYDGSKYHPSHVLGGDADLPAKE